MKTDLSFNPKTGKISETVSITVETIDHMNKVLSAYDDLRKAVESMELKGKGSRKAKRALSELDRIAI